MLACPGAAAAEEGRGAIGVKTDGFVEVGDRPVVIFRGEVVVAARDQIGGRERAGLASLLGVIGCGLICAGRSRNEQDAGEA